MRYLAIIPLLFTVAALAPLAAMSWSQENGVLHMRLKEIDDLNPVAVPHLTGFRINGSWSIYVRTDSLWKIDARNADTTVIFRLRDPIDFDMGQPVAEVRLVVDRSISLAEFARRLGASP